MAKITDFQSIRLKLASPQEILSWSHGEVTKPETINYRTQRPEKDGLFCEKIFGPEKDWECYCGKYRRIRYKGVICEKCGVEVTRSIVRRERMGHISLATPVSHIWFLRGVPSKIGLILDMSVQNLEKVIYYASYIITKIDEEAREKLIKEMEKEYKTKLSSLAKTENSPTKISEMKRELKEKFEKTKAEINSLHKFQILSELEYQDLSVKYSSVFEVGIGAEAIRKLLSEISLEDLKKDLQNKLNSVSNNESIGQDAGAIERKILKRLRLVEGMIRAKIRPEWMILTVLPVLPPDLRPMIALDGGRYASSDLNDLYRRVINRNNRLKKLIELNAPEVICRNEKRMLQEAVDALIDNSSRRGQSPVMASAGQKRSLKSLADILKGKQGRFRQNLLGKRVDYSGRSVIVVGPELKIHQCGLPKRMALELFKPFVISELIEKEVVHNIKVVHNIRGANKLIEEETDEVWAALEKVVQNRFVLLNRAPTLHRLGIQAFRPVLIEGSAIQIHPLVCRAFNADFDGDQMAVHLPLTNEAQKEAKEIMLSSLGLLKPATGEPIAVPTQDIILGCFWITKIVDGLKGEGKIFSSIQEAILAYQFGEVDLRARIKVRINSAWFRDKNSSDGFKAEPHRTERGTTQKNKEVPRGSAIIETCVGRIILNEALPEEMDFINEEMNKKSLQKLVSQLIENFGIERTAPILDKIKEIGFEYATQSGISWGIDDLQVPAQKPNLIKEAEKEVEITHQHYLNGLLTREERRSKIIEIWFSIIDKISKEVRQSLSPSNPVGLVIDSGSRGSWGQISQMIGIKGLVTNPASEIIELPVKSSFKEGFNVLEYFISTHGARKGTTDTALRTSTAGYLTRRLVDVAQEVVVREKDCQDKEGIFIYREDAEIIGKSLASQIIGRVSLEEIRDKKELIVKKGQLINKTIAEKIDKLGVDKIRVRSVISCKTKGGVCQSCYGYDLSTNQLVKIGEAVGIVAAQAIGEPGTQLTLRTFHTGGVAGVGDITQGLPRVEEIFEVQPPKPKNKALISEVDGKVLAIDQKENKKIIKIRAISERKELPKILEYVVPSETAIWVNKGDSVCRGQQLTEGHIDLKELFRIAGLEPTVRYILREVQNIYTSQGEGVNPKHIEIIIRQMFSRVRIKDPGDSDLLIGEEVEKSKYLLANEEALEKNKRPAKAQQLLLGISKVALSTDSWLSAASFQETARVLINAAVYGKEDKLRNLKENVIIGKLIPAGTGFRKDFLKEKE